LIPCFNEELTIDKVIADLKNRVPEAEIYVFDNNSTDKTTEIANSPGAVAITRGYGPWSYTVEVT